MNSAAPLDAGQVDFFRENGYLVIPQLFSQEYVAALRARIEELCADWESEAARQAGVMQEPGLRGAESAGATTIRKFSALNRVEPLFEAHAHQGALLDVVEQLLGTPLSLYEDQALLKPPFHGSEKPEHQDNAYFRVEPADHVITCWTALDDADLENGCMHYYPGSHRLGLVDHRAIKGTPHLVPQGFDRAQSVPVPIDAGGCILHHSLTVHWSPANNSPRWRRAFVVHYVRSDAQMNARHPHSPPLPQVRSGRAPHRD
jgi:phytanoyl-CoA hydroxylase